MPGARTALFLDLEYEAALRRPEQVEVHRFFDFSARPVFAGFAALSEPIDVHFVRWPELSDVKDELALEAAAFTGRGLLPMFRAAAAGNRRHRIHPDHMRNEIQNLVDEIKQAISLLRRHL